MTRLLIGMPTVISQLHKNESVSTWNIIIRTLYLIPLVYAYFKYTMFRELQLNADYPN
jgi:hypothetical protein